MIAPLLVGIWAAARAWVDELLAPRRARRAARVKQRRRGRLVAIGAVRRAR